MILATSSSHYFYNICSLYCCYSLLLSIKKKNFYNNQWTFKQAFKFGLFLTGLLTILNPLAQYILYESISPDYFENIIEYQLAKGRSTREELLSIHNIDLKIREGVTNTLSIGVIFTAMFAFILKNKTQENELK